MWPPDPNDESYPELCGLPIYVNELGRFGDPLRWSLFIVSKPRRTAASLGASDCKKKYNQMDSDTSLMCITGRRRGTRRP